VLFSKPLLRLPNLAIHLNRGVNDEGLKLQKQNELPLILSAISQEQLPKAVFLELLAQQTGVNAEQILSWDLVIYDTQKGSFWGANNEFYANSQLDNLASCHAALSALLDESVLAAGNTQICAFFDHEEIGSESSKGADGSFLSTVLQRISQTQSDEDTARTLANSFMISADMAHAYQPNFPLAYEPEHKVLVNQGVVIKSNANHRYSSDSVSAAMFALWCEQVGVAYQHYVQRCDLACGSTVGPMTAAKLGIRAVDVGNPMWAMHSVRESAGVFDHEAMILVMKQFFRVSDGVKQL
jgi:aspartyl aminopeptidase